MAQIAREKKSTVKKVAYEKKQEEGGKKVLEWIFGVLVVSLSCLSSIPFSS
jgi:hypothetical protein